jgi:hypothetical protein
MLPLWATHHFVILCLNTCWATQTVIQSVSASPPLGVIDSKQVHASTHMLELQPLHRFDAEKKS